MPDLTEPDFSDIERAAERIAGIAVRTPLLESTFLNERVNGRVFIKPENLQQTGSFKFRGATNRMSYLSVEERSRGVIAFSSGNHAQAVALAAKQLGTAATIVMPEDAPKLKLANTRGHGAEVVIYNRRQLNREDLAAEMQQKTGAVLIPPFDDPRIIAGQGTAGMELAADLRERDIRADALLVPCGGGGLTAGCALAFRHLSPETEIYTVEPEDYNDTARSFEAGRRITIEPERLSICDALLLPCPGELTFRINSRLVKGGLIVSDAEARTAMRFAFERLKLVVEPGGAVTLAALLAGRFDAAGRTVAIVLSGGNVDPERFTEALEQPD